MLQATANLIKESSRLLMNKLVEQLEEIMVWERPNHRLDVCHKHGKVCIYDTSKSNKHGDHILIGSVTIEECVEYLKLFILIESLNSVYDSQDDYDLFMKWNPDYRYMELFSQGYKEAWGSPENIKKAIQKRIALNFIATK